MGTRLDILEGLKRRLAEVEKRILGDDPAYRRRFLFVCRCYIPFFGFKKATARHKLTFQSGIGSSNFS